MATRKADKEFVDAKGDRHVHYADGRSEIYHRWTGNEQANFMEITDATDKSVNRRRFLPWTKTQSVEESLTTRDDPEIVTGDIEDPEQHF